jgi:hypothetical protein
VQSWVISFSPELWTSDDNASQNTASLTLWYRTFLEQLIVILSVKISRFHGTRRFITIFIKACHWILYWQHQSNPEFCTLFQIYFSIISSHLYQSLWSGLFSWGFPTKILYAFLYCPMCSTHLMLLIFLNHNKIIRPRTEVIKLFIM